MDEQSVGAVLAQDISEHFVMIELAAFVAMLVLAITGVVLAARAYTVLAEVRGLYWRAAAIQGEPSAPDAERQARAAAIRASASKRKVGTGRARHVM